MSQVTNCRRPPYWVTGPCSRRAVQMRRREDQKRYIQSNTLCFGDRKRMARQRSEGSLGIKRRRGRLPVQARRRHPRQITREKRNAGFRMRGRQQGLPKRLRGTTRPQWKGLAKANNHELTFVHRFACGPCQGGQTACRGGGSSGSAHVEVPQGCGCRLHLDSPTVYIRQPDTAATESQDPVG